MYREGKVEDFLDEVRSRYGTEHSLNAVLLLLHVCLFVELREERNRLKQTDDKFLNRTTSDHKEAVYNSLSKPNPL